MGARLSNESASFKAQNGMFKQGKVGRAEINSSIFEWDFFKKIDGLSTDFIAKYIPSTAFTPGLTMPSKAALNNILAAQALISGIYKKATQIASVFDKDSNNKIKEQYLKKAIALSSRGYK